MTAKHISDGRQRRSKLYLAKHCQLAAELKAPEPELSKSERKRQASQFFRQTGN